jgi:hypothetical protein
MDEMLEVMPPMGGLIQLIIHNVKRILVWQQEAE